MKTCPHCNIHIGGAAAYCPLCQNRISGPDEAPWWPKITPPVRRFALLYKIIAFVLLAGVVAGAAVDFLLIETPHRHESLVVLAWVLVALLELRAVLRRRFNGPRQVFTLLLLISGLLVFTDWFHGYRGYSIDLVIPILCSVTLVCNFVFAFWRSHFTQNALVYMLLNIGVGVLPYLLLFFRIGTGRLDTHSIPWVICLIISAVTCLGLIIFQGRALRSELEKRLHM